MKYLFLAYEDAKHWDALPASERDAIKKVCVVNDEALRRSSHLLAAEGFEGSNAAVTVRVYNGEVSLASDPCAETTAQLIGLFFTNARDLNEAIQVASKMPQARSGPIEVQPIMSPDSQTFG